MGRGIELIREIRLSNTLCCEDGATEILSSGITNHPRAKALLKRFFGTTLGPLVRTDRTPGPAARAAESSIDDLYFAVFRKRADASRRFDHFVPF